MTEADKKLAEELRDSFCLNKNEEGPQDIRLWMCIAQSARRLVAAELAGKVVDYDKFPIVEFVGCSAEIPAQVAFETGAQVMKQVFAPILAALAAKLGAAERRPMG